MKRSFLNLIVLLFVATLFTGCREQLDPPSVEELSPATVRVQSVQLQDHQIMASVIGTIRSRTNATLAAKIPGRIHSMPVVLGQQVEPGEVLVELDADDIRAGVDRANALLAQANQELERYRTLLSRQAVTRQAHETIEAQQRVAQANFEEAKAQLANATVLAPFQGIVSAKHADVGDLATLGRPLLLLEDPLHLNFEAHGSESLIDHVQVGDVLPVTVQPLGMRIESTVYEMAPTADPQSRTVLFKLNLPPHDKLRSGQFGRVDIPKGRRPTLRIPSKALVQRGQMELVFVVENQSARLRLVKTGKHEPDGIEILSGVSADEVIVIEGAGQLRDGQRLDIQP